MSKAKPPKSTQRNPATDESTLDDDPTDELPQLACIDAPCATPRHCMSVGERCLQGIDDGQLFNDLPQFHSGE